MSGASASDVPVPRAAVAATVLAGFVVGAGVALLAWWWWVDRTDANYLHQRFGQVFLRPVSVMLFASSGGLLAAVVAAARTVAVPAASAVASWVAAIVVGGASAWAANRVFGGASTYVAAGAGVLAGALAGARRTMPRAWPPALRWSLVGVVALSMAAVLPRVLPVPAWPGDDASEDERSRWGRETFPTVYPVVEGYLREHPVVVAGVGEVLSVVPVGGANRQRTTMFARSGRLTLRVRGPVSGGRVELGFTNTSKSDAVPQWNFSGTFTPDGGARQPLE